MKGYMRNSFLTESLYFQGDFSCAFFSSESHAYDFNMDGSPSSTFGHVTGRPTRETCKVENVRAVDAIECSSGQVRLAVLLSFQKGSSRTDTDL